MSSRVVTEMDGKEAKRFFLKHKSYINFDLPPYMDFSQLLVFTSAAIGKQTLNDLCKKDRNGKPMSSRNFEGVNYTILSNKDGAYSWRPLQLIHPVLYVELINVMTEKKNWKIITDRFEDFSKGYIKCISLPRESLTDASDTASQINNWWEQIEQQSLKKSLEFDYIYSTDITDCYGSIYTHSVEWALDKDGKQGVKANRATSRKASNILGASIDNRLMNMNRGQTNGIPQGSALMDFIAEIVLGYADLELTEKIKSEGIKPSEFFILRYRDDYRILTNNPPLGRLILKHLNHILYELGLKMNPTKTSESADVITSSLKKEKVEAITTAPIQQYFQKEAVRIYQLSKKYPNSGLVLTQLEDFYDRLSSNKNPIHVDYEVLIAIFTMISVLSPRTIHWTAAINSKIMERIKDEKKRAALTRLIINKFSKMPNIGFIDVWLQRISAPIGIEVGYKDRLTKLNLAEINNSELWNCDWLKKPIKDSIDIGDVSQLKYQLDNKLITPVIERAEVETFRKVYF